MACHSIGVDSLIAAPTGSGKTFAAFFSCIDHLFKQALARDLDDHTQVLYVSPLKALSNDIRNNLQQPLVEIGNAALSAGLLMPELRVLVRIGNTPMMESQQMLKRSPHILVTTQESFCRVRACPRCRRISWCFVTERWCQPFWDRRLRSNRTSSLGETAGPIWLTRIIDAVRRDIAEPRRKTGRAEP